MAPSATVTAATKGDLDGRDLYARDIYRRGTTTVSDTQYILSGTSAYNASTQVSSLDTDLSGAYQVFVKSSGTGTSIDTSGTPALSVTPSLTTVSSTTLEASGSFKVQDVTFTQDSGTFKVSLPSDGSVTTYQYTSSEGDTLMTLNDSGSVTMNQTLLVSGDFLAAADLYATGTSTFYGDVEIEGSFQVDTSSIVLGASETSLDGAGLYLGASTSSPTATLLYKTSTGIESSGGWLFSKPIVYAGTSTTAELGNGGVVTVFNNSSTGTYTQMDANSVQFNQKWRLYYNSGTDELWFQHYESSSWVTKAKITS